MHGWLGPLKLARFAHMAASAASTSPSSYKVDGMDRFTFPALCILYQFAILGRSLILSVAPMWSR